MAQKNGRTVTSTMLISGKNVTSISAINGVLTSNISGWPSAGPTCKPLMLSYGPNFNDPCGSEPFPYDFDPDNNLLYVEGLCGMVFAVAGYYSNGVEQYYWDGSSMWILIGGCR